jgi:hypothetical protein
METEDGQGSTTIPMYSDIARLVDDLELKKVYFASLHADLRHSGDPEAFKLSVATSFAVRDGKVLYRFATYCTLLGKTEEAFGAEPPTLAVLDMKMICEFEVLTGHTVPAENQIEEFGSTTAFAIVYPYLREAVGSSLVRLGFPSLNIGLLRRGDIIFSEEPAEHRP